MKRIGIITCLAICLTILYQCERPKLLDREAELKIENTSNSNYITGVYFGTVGPGSINKISKDIGPGESKIFTINIEDDSNYDIRITSNQPGNEEYTETHYDFYWDETYIIELTEDGWYTDSSW